MLFVNTFVFILRKHLIIVEYLFKNIIRRGIEEDDGHNEVDALVNKTAEVPTVVTAVDTQ